MDEKEMIIEKEDGYYLLQTFNNESKEIKITNFKIEITDILDEEINNEIVKTLSLRLYNNQISILGDFTSKHTTDLRSFNCKVRGLETSFSTYNLRGLGLEAIIRYIHKDIKIKPTKVVNFKGYISKYNIWVFQEGIVYEKLYYKFNENNICELEDFKIKLSLDNNKGLPSFHHTNNFNIKNYIINDFRYIFNGIGGDLVLGFLISSLFVNSLKKELKPFPILFVSGKKGSGKTQALSIALNILGLKDITGNAEADNLFVDQFSISEVCSLPIWSDEFKNGKKTKEKNGFYKTIFDRNGSSKGAISHGGSRNLKVENYDINGTFILSGEQAPSDDALFSRCCLVNVSGKREGENIYSEILKRSYEYTFIFREILFNKPFSETIEDFLDLLNYSKKILISYGVEKRIFNVFLPIVSGYLFFNRYILKNNFHTDKQGLEKWFNEIIEVIKLKLEEEEEEDLINYFFGIINNLYSDPSYNKLTLADGYIKITNTGVHIFYNQLFTSFQLKNKLIDGREISKRDFKKDLIATYNVKESKMIIGGGKRENSLLFSLNNIPSNLKNLVDYIEENVIKENILYDN